MSGRQFIQRAEEPRRYPPVRGSGGKVPFTPDDPPAVADSVMDHIMIGEPRKRGWTGGHGYGERGHPNFPEAWSREIVRTAVERILAGPPDLTIERYGATLFFRSVIDGLPMLVRVKGRPGKPKVRTALPDPDRIANDD